jgi:oligoendopeptidase F
MGHSMHTMYSHEQQPFVYSDYTIFVAEVPSTLNEALLLEHWLANTTDRVERIVLLQHAIDNITSTFFTQVQFADFELAVHELVERDEPITADVLNALYRERFEAYYGDTVEMETLTPITWARIPHFFNSPYYVYQYATCFASAAKLAQELMQGTEVERRQARARYLDLLGAGGSDHPMTLLKAAGVDLSQPETVQAVIAQLDTLVDRLDAEVSA